jgi:hypothetical protein
VDQIGDLPARTFEECCIRWLREKEHKRSLDDDRTKIEFWLQHFAGRDVSKITAEEIQGSRKRDDQQEASAGMGK